MNEDLVQGLRVLRDPWFKTDGSLKLAVSVFSIFVIFNDSEIKGLIVRNVNKNWLIVFLKYSILY